MSDPVVPYSTGQLPIIGDRIEYADQSPTNRRVNKEAREAWIVISICRDMINAKCVGTETWKQAFFTTQMALIRRGTLRESPTA